IVCATYVGTCQDDKQGFANIQGANAKYSCFCHSVTRRKCTHTRPRLQPPHVCVSSLKRKICGLAPAVCLNPYLHAPSGGGNSSPYFFPISITRGMSCCCCGLSAPISSKNPSKPDGVMTHMSRPGVLPR